MTRLAHDRTMSRVWIKAWGEALQEAAQRDAPNDSAPAGEAETKWSQGRRQTKTRVGGAASARVKAVRKGSVQRRRREW